MNLKHDKLDKIMANCYDEILNAIPYDVIEEHLKRRKEAVEDFMNER